MDLARAGIPVAAMLNNPVNETRDAPTPAPFHYPFIVTCVVPFVDELDRHPSFHVVKKFCEENDVQFSCRDYNHIRYEEDCDYISRMPAFHFYFTKPREYDSTWFYDENPIQKIQKRILEWNDEQLRKQQRKEAWQHRMTRLREVFTISLKKKPKMIVPKRAAASVARVPIQYGDT